MAAARGMVTAIQSTKVRWRPASSCSMPMAMRFGGDATGIPTATEEDQLSIRSRATVKGPAVSSACRLRRITRVTGSMMAAVAVLLTQREITQVTRPSAARRRPGVRVAQGSPSRAKTKRRSNPEWRNASARMKLPMKRKMTGSA
jgi:hypothetical protein